MSKTIDKLKQELYDYVSNRESTEEIMQRVMNLVNGMSDSDFNSYIVRTTDIKREDDKPKCTICEGSGTVEYEQDGEPVTDRCNRCNGEGVVDE